MATNLVTTGTRIAELLATGRPALIGYLPIGFPTVNRSIEAVCAAIDAGLDIVELGLPYTDPVMDGPVIQRADEVALQHGTRTADVFRVIEAVKAHAPHVPVLVMSYWNLLAKYGIDQFAADLVSVGGAGLITPDLIPDEGAAWIAAADEYGLDKVFLVAPSSTPARLELTAKASRGFVYASSTMGVTGLRSEVGKAARRLVADTRAAGAKHVCVGLGVSTKTQAAEVGEYADGVIAGSAFVRPLQGDVAWAERLDNLQAVVDKLAAGVVSARM